MADPRTKVKKKGSVVKNSQRSEISSKNSEQVEAAIRAQVAAEEKAHRIVEKLVMEENVGEEYFIEIGNYITPSHYLDITEERALAKVCGYPLCTNPMAKILQQKYKISLQTNRVFDISERKHFCSNQCYKASKFYEAQIPTSPVWSRTKEETKTFTLLKTSDQSARSGGGDVMVGSATHQMHNINDDTEDDIKATDKTNDHSCTDSSESRSEDGSIPHAVQSGMTGNCETKNNFYTSTCDNQSDISNISKFPTDTSEVDKIDSQKVSSEKFKSNKKDITDLSKVNMNCYSHTNYASDTEVSKKGKGFHVYNKTKCKEDEMSMRNIFVTCIKETLREWFTSASYQYLNNKVENSPSDGQAGQVSDALLSFNERALGFLRLDNKSHESEGDGDDNHDDDEDMLKTKTQITSEDITTKEREHTSKDFACVVPPIDSKSQVAIRRKIVLQKMTTLLPELIESSQFNIREIENHFSKLVKTFRLSSQNVMFKPMEWRGLAASLLYLIHQNLYLNFAGTLDIKQTMEATLHNLSLTHQDMIDISNSLNMKRTADSNAETTQNETKDRKTESYSHMEDLD